MLQRSQVSGNFIWKSFMYGVGLANLLWGYFFLQRISNEENTPSCAGSIWFYITYGTTMSCCYMIFLYMSFPKRIMQRRDFNFVQRSLIVPKLAVIFSFIYLVNNVTLFIAALNYYFEGECMGKLTKIICYIAFVSCWIVTLVCCFCLKRIMRDALRIINVHITVTGIPEENHIELLQILH